MRTATRFLKLAALGAFLALTPALLSGCADTATVAAPDYRNFNNDVPISFNANKIDVFEDFTPHNGAPYIDHLMERNPSQAIQEWTSQRLHAEGGPGYIQIRIREAGVISRSLPKTTGVRAYFTNDQAEELVARIVVDIKGSGGPNGFEGFTTIETSQLLTIDEDATEADRKARERELINKLMVEFNRKAEQGINNYLAPLLARRAP